MERSVFARRLEQADYLTDGEDIEGGVAELASLVDDLVQDAAPMEWLLEARQALGAGLARTGRYDEATVELEAVVAGAAPDDHRRRADAGIELGTTRRFANDLDGCLAAYQAAIAAAREEGDRSGEVRILALISMAIAHSGDLASAQDVLDEGFALAAETPDLRPVGRGRLLRQAAELAIQRGDYDDARTHLRDARQAYEQAGSTVGLANVERMLGITANELGHGTAARAHFESALAGYGTNQIGRAIVLRWLVRVAIEQDASSEAVELARAAVAASDAAGHDNRVVEARIQLVHALVSAGRMDEAHVVLAQAEELSEAFDNPRERRRLRAERADLLQRDGRDEEARALLEPLLDDVRRADDDPLLIAAVEEMSALVWARTGRIAEAAGMAIVAVNRLEQIGGALRSEEDRAGLFRQRGSSYDTAVLLTEAAGDHGAALRVMEMGRAEVLATALTRTADGPGEVQIGADLRSWIGTVSQAPVDLLAMRRRGRHLVSIRLTRQQPRVLASVAIGPEGDTEMLTTVLSDDALSRLDAFERRVANAPWTRADAVAHELSTALFPPNLRQALMAREVDELVVVGGESVTPYPLASLPIGDHPLCELTAVSTCPSLGVLHALTSRDAPSRRTAPRVCAYHDLRIPGMAAEVAALEHHVTVHALPPEPEALLHEAQGADVLVIGAHGSGHRGWEQYLELPAGRLTAGRLAAAQLPPLVILGSCWAGRIDLEAGREPLGLATACLLGGARNVIGGLFRIHSTATAEILASAFPDLISGGAVSAALSNAQFAYLKDHPDAMVDEWVGLQVVGLGVR